MGVGFEMLSVGAGCRGRIGRHLGVGRECWCRVRKWERVYWLYGVAVQWQGGVWGI